MQSSKEILMPCQERRLTYPGMSPLPLLDAGCWMLDSYTHSFELLSTTCHSMVRVHILDTTFDCIVIFYRCVLWAATYLPHLETCIF